jgi:hypothetical protein
MAGMKRLICSLLLLSVPSFALDGVYLGAQVGHVGGPGTSPNAIGFGIDIAVPTGAYLDAVLHAQYSDHGGLTLLHPTLDAQVHLVQTGDFDLTAEAGPGFYFLGGTGSATKFGVNVGTNGDLIVQDQLHLGLGFRYHILFDSPGAGDFYTVMLRVGYELE